MRLAAPLLALACCAPVASAAPRSLQYIPSPPAPPPAPPCACESCVQKDNAVEDCESFGMDCSCFDGCACEDCVREGNSVAECESTGILCACDAGGGDLPGGDDACGDLTARTKAVTDECCDEPTEDCSSGRPSRPRAAHRPSRWSGANRPRSRKRGILHRVPAAARAARMSWLGCW